MSNKQRKNRGSQKIARNLYIRLRRGAVKAGTPLPGDGAWRAGHDAAVTTRGAQLREDIDRYTAAYWRGA